MSEAGSTDQKQAPELEPRHPIGAVTQRTGLSTHVLRAWERRYGVVEPARSEGGHRLYSDADVEKLRILHRLTLHGRQIGQVADLSMEELEELLREDRQAEATAPGAEDLPDDAETVVDELLQQAYAAVAELDAERLDALLRRGAVSLSAGGFLDDLFVPLMVRIGEAWAEKELRPAHEHLASAVAARVTGWLMDNVEPPAGAPTLVVCTPAGQEHELGALGAAVTAVSEGWRVRYLGSNLPAEDVALAARKADARAVALSLVFPLDDPEVREELRRIRQGLPEGLPVLVGGGAAGSYEDTLSEIRALRLNGFRSLRAVLRRLRRDARNGAPEPPEGGSV